MDSFTTGCFCPEGKVKMFPVANNTAIEPNNQCVTDCSKVSCSIQCPNANEEHRECGPTSTCDNQICRGVQPICTEEDAAICVAGCFCVSGFSRFNGECIQQCPLLP